MEQLFRDPNVPPSTEALSAALGDSFFVWCLFSDTLPEYTISVEWRYYNDGKAWFAKGVSGKKTVFWGSIWEGFFKTALYFTEKTRAGIQALDISEDIKRTTESEPPRGKIIPLVIDVKSEDQLKDVFTLVDYKRRIK